MTPREEQIKRAWEHVGVEPNQHAGTDPALFSTLMVGEWFLGQWADMIDSGSPWMNQAHHISVAQFEKVHPNG